LEEFFAFTTQLLVRSGNRKQIRHQAAYKLDWGSATIQTESRKNCGGGELAPAARHEKSHCRDALLPVQKSTGCWLR